MLFLIIERFRDGDPRPVYRRFAAQGRLAPEGLDYVASWVTEDLRRCYQVMECDDPALLQAWMERWRDLVDFEAVRVLGSPAAAAAVAAMGDEPRTAGCPDPPAELLADLRFEFRRHKALAERAIAAVDDRAFFERPGDDANSIAIVVKHLAGNLLSRWTDFLDADGEKPTRDRDGEFVVGAGDTRVALLAAWERGWGALFATLDALGAADLSRTVSIRGEAFTVQQALLRGLTHAAYHVGQILLVARLLRPDAPWLTVAPGRSRDVAGEYRLDRARTGGA